MPDLRYNKHTAYIQFICYFQAFEKFCVDGKIIDFKLDNK